VQNLYDLLSLEWFLPKAVFGLGLGFVFRVAEHFAYKRRRKEPEKNFILWSAVMLTQSVCVGLPLAYIGLGILISKFPSQTFITGAAYMLPVMTSFIAVDLRELVRRLYRKAEH
jgi:hypothetical protein